MTPVRATLLRSAGTTTLLFAVYYAAPGFSARTSWSAIVLVAVGTVGVAAVLAWQTRVIARSETPRLRAIDALAVSAPLFLVTFATAYHVLSGVDPESFTERLSRHDALYLTITVFSTTGFGDIAPVSAPARLLASVQMIGNMIFLGLGIRVLVTAAQIGAKGPPRFPSDDRVDTSG
ncbi:potassium channel family protein [Cryptosporangium aurantiacum]|uniref:Ion channel n=1 Tax=Cryptosporangium aurantiacum TaxID=134849 RepID=A0A1M7RGD3_9ACTN|nr:potassium channel family protein [Cryptosporangium aurantiacum]SHN45098.1 Ion channel [Cryptosporangium aurantiacum]